MYWHLYIIGSIIPLILYFSRMWKEPKKKRPDFRDLVNYFSWIMYPLMGYIVFILYQDIVTTKILAFHLGASSPLILEAFSKSVPKINLFK